MARLRFSLLAVCAGLVVGCMPGVRKPIAITDHRAYLLAEVPDQFDITAVAGRRIVLDPGHGGPRPGAVGTQGVREADVNLGVGLHLWGLLHEAGADVQLTRTVDGDVSSVANATLKQDLQARADVANANQPDIFISLHHNADIIPGSKKNALETYYQLRGDAPSLDLAQAVHRHLALNLGERDNAILPGNFHVIREIGVPGILGEASYISSAENETHLAHGAMQRLEAEAYFLGIVEYFSRGVPRIRQSTPGDGERVMQLDGVTVEFELDRGVPIDPATIDVRIDGKPLSVLYDAVQATARAPLPRRLPSGVYTLTASARNVRGNGTRLHQSTFTLAAPVDRVQVDANPRFLHPEAARTSIVSARVLDAWGMPVLDGTTVTFAASTGTLVSAQVGTVGGVATTYWHGGPDDREAAITVHCGDVTSGVGIGVDPQVRPTSVVQFQNAATGRPIAEAILHLQDTFMPVNQDGVALIAGPPGTAFRASAPGYWPRSMATNVPGDAVLQEASLVPVADGVLHGRVIAIDAADGGVAGGAAGPTGLRAADINLRVARYLGDYVRSAGGRPVLTRTADETTSPFQRVERSEAAAAARFISIRHGAVGAPDRMLDESGLVSTSDVSRGIVVEHYPSSVGGRRLAGLLHDALVDTLPPRRGRIMQSVAYELTHTACPAVRVQPLTPLDAESELLLSEPREQRKIAYAIFGAVLEDFGAEPEAFAGLAGKVRDADGAPVSGATVAAGDLWLAVTDERGRFAFQFLPPGEIALVVTPMGQAAHVETVALPAGKSVAVRITVDRDSL